MFTQFFPLKRSKNLSVGIFKSVFVLIFLFCGFAPIELSGQVVVHLEDIGGSYSEGSKEAFNLQTQAAVQVSPYQFTLIDVYPNPFHHKLTIGIPTEEHLTFLELVNAEGHIVWQQSVSAIPDRYDIESLEAGTYYLNLFISGEEFTETLIYQP